MRIFGIDPGSRVTGYGVVEQRRGRYHLVDAGCVRTRATAMGDRLAEIHAGVVTKLREHEPDEVAIEAIFKHRSAESALVLGQARGVALLAAAQCGYEAVPYNAMTVKRSVGAHGRADKAAVARMVEALLGRQLDLPTDATDAIAIAITHAAHARMPRAVAR